MNIFISYNHKNSAFVNSIIENLRKLKSEITIFNDLFFDQDNIKEGQIWTEEIKNALDKSHACIVFIGEQGIGHWQNKEVLAAINKNVDSQGEFKVIPVIISHNNREHIKRDIPWFLADVQWLEFKHEADTDAFQKLADRLFNSDGNLFPVSKNADPYKGLDFFNVEDAAFFFGRVFDVNWIFYKKYFLQSRSGNRLLAIVGDSGSGKSSFARAGILATIKAGGIPGSESWKQVIFTPEDNPLLNLFAALQSAGIVADAKKAEDEAKTDADTLRRILSAYAQEVVLLVDQFEEVVTQCKDNASRQAFLDNITKAFKSPHFICIITLRSDFYSAFSAFREFADMLEASNYTITSLDHNTAGDEWEHYLKAIIQKPARLLGVQFDNALTNQIIEDCKGINGVLPVLQLTLAGLWKKRNDQLQILPSHYDRLANGKGLAGIIETHANSTWGLLTRDGADVKMSNLIKAVFIRLVEVTTNKEDVRKTVNKKDLINELRSQFNPDEVEKALNVLSGPEARLIRIKNEEGNDISTNWIEVIHEVLIRQWGMFRKWLNERREAIIYKNKLEQYIDDQNKPLTGKKLRIAEQWIKLNKDLVTDKMNNFILMSRRHVKRKRYAFGAGLAFILVVFMIYRYYECKSYPLVETWEDGNYKIDEVHTVTINSLSELNCLHCFKRIDTLIVEVKDIESYLSQESIDLMPSNVKKLSLNGFSKSDTMLNFKKFSSLKILNISSVLIDLQTIGFTHLDSLVELKVFGLKNNNALNGIGDLKGLRSLSISTMYNLTNLQGFKDLTNLQSLDLSNLDNLTSLEGIENMKSLQTLKLSGLNRLSGLDGIENLESLQTLRLSGLIIPSLAGIENLQNLQSLSLFDLVIRGISEIEDLGLLQSLSLSRLRITSLKGIEHLKRLKSLRLSALLVTSLAGVENLKKLQTLSVSGLHINDIPGFEDEEEAYSATLLKLSIPDLSEIQNLENLEALHLADLDSLQDLAGIEKLENLQTLTLSGLKIIDLSAIKSLKNLQSLNLSGLPGLAGIDELESLTRLKLSSLPMKNLSGIKNLVNLRLLTLSNVNVSSLTDITSLKNLEVLHLVSLDELTTLSGIESLKNLRLLSLDKIGEENIQIPALAKENSIDTVIMVHKIKLDNLDFIDKKSKVKVFIYDNGLELPDRENKILAKANEARETKFFNKSMLAGSLYE